MRYKIYKIVWTIILILGLFSWAGGVRADSTGINKQINFQGKVVKTDGTNVTDGNYNFTFSIYSVASAGTSLWSEVWNSGTTQPAVTSGIFSVNLGTYATFPPAVDFNSNSLYLGIIFNGDTEMVPRIRMAAVPYAMNATTVNGLTVTNSTGTLTIPNGTTIAFGGALTTTGVGITLNQSLSTGDTVTFAGLSVGGTVAFTNIPVAVGTTVLFIDSTGKLTQGFMAMGTGTTYVFTNGLTDPGTHIVGLGGTLAANTQIGVSSFSLMFTNSSNILTIGASGYVGIGTTNPLYKFHVVGDQFISGHSAIGIAVTNPLFALDVGGTAHFLNVFSDGNVGIGYTAPRYLLDVNGVGNFIQLGVGGTNSAYSLNVGASGLNVGGTLNVSGLTILGSGFTANATSYATTLNVGSTLNVTGLSVLGNGFTANNTSYVTTLNVGSTLNVTGLTVLGNGFTANATSYATTLNVGSTLNVTGLSVLGNGFTANATSYVTTLNVGSTLNVSGLTVLGNGFTANALSRVSSLAVGNSLSVGSTILTSNLFSTGNVGIGMTIPKYLLDILNSSGTGATMVAQFQNLNNAVNNNGIYVNTAAGDTNSYIINAAGSNGTSRFMIRANGNVGIGTTAPNALVDIFGTNAPQMRLSYSGLLFSTFGTNSSGNLNIATTNAAGSGIDILSGINAGNGTNEAITLGSLQTLGANDELFGLSNNTNQAFTILGSGNVGIGITLPNYKFQVAGDEFISGRSNIGVATTNPLFALNVGGTANFVNLFTSGYVGIGTTNPGAALEINSGSGGVAGLKFTQLTSNSATGATNNKVLTVDTNGNIYLAPDQTGVGGTGIPTGNVNGQTLRFGVGTSQWQVSNFVFNNEQNFGIGTTATIATVEINGVGTTDLLRLDSNGVNKVRVSSAGGVSVNSTTSDVVKNTVGTTTVSDFYYPGLGSTLVNVAQGNNMLTVGDTTFPGSGAGAVSTTSIGTTGNVGLGGQVIMRDDGQYVVINGGTSATGGIWDGIGTTMKPITVSTGTSFPGAGAIALKLPNRKYLLVYGNSNGWSSIFDPYNLSAAAAGPSNLFGSTATPAGAGTNAFMRPDGKYVIMGGGTTAWGVYDPTVPVYTGGTAVGLAFGAGCLPIARDDGTVLVLRGGGTTNSWIYDPYAGGYAAGAPVGTMSQDVIAAGASMPTIGAASLAIKRQDGKYLILDSGTTNTSWIYDPNGTIGTSAPWGTMTPQAYGIGVTLTDGAQALWRQDGKYLILLGTGQTATVIYDPSQSGSGQFTAGPFLAAMPGSGMTAFMGTYGKYFILMGGGTTAVEQYDMGYTIGGSNYGTTGPDNSYYESECMGAASLNPTSSLTWDTNNSGTFLFQVRTGNGSCSGSTYKPILRAGDMISPNTGDNMIQIRVTFRRDLPNFSEPAVANQEWGLRRANRVNYRKINVDPVLFDLKVDNSSDLHRTQFAFGDSNNDSGPDAYNMSLNADKSMSLSMQAAGAFQGSSLNITNNQFYNGTFGAHSVMQIGISTTSLVMRRFDGKYTVVVGTGTTILGSGTTNVQVYDPAAQTFTTGTSMPTLPIGLGTLAFKRPDGKYLVVIGNGSSATNLYDPVLNIFTTQPVTANTTGVVGAGSQTIALPNGRVLILHGNYTNTSSIYDPFQNTMIPGPVTSSNVGTGSMVIPRPDGTFLVNLGNGVTQCGATGMTTNQFNPYTMMMGSTSPTIGAAGLATGPGALYFPRSDGQFVVIYGGGTTLTCANLTTTVIYNPFNNLVTAGTALSVANGPGGQAIPRPDGTWLVTHGTGVNTTNIYLEKTGAPASGYMNLLGTWIVGPTAVNVQGSGALVFQRDDGKFVNLVGGGITAVNLYDGMWVNSGNYKSEQIQVSDLDPNTSTLTWRGSPTLAGITAEVRTASSQASLQTAAFRELQSPGSLIGASAGDSWVQVNFNFIRTFPSYGGLNTDVWYNNGQTVNYTNRTIATPTLNEFEITKDSSLLNLQADGMSVFRVSSNGNVYTNSNTAINAGGADLAENYTSDVALDKGELVAIDPNNPAGIVASKYQYQPDLLGVVSSHPGFVAGSTTANSYPVALVGRVPVEVSDENGVIKTGDMITASSISGYGMKATKAGRVIGQALETMDESQLNGCPEGNFGNQGQKCGTIEMFVNLTNYLGEPMEQMMADKGINDQSDESILNFLKDYQDNVVQTRQGTSTVTADRIVADTILANTIKANQIVGLDVFTNQIATLSAEYSQLLQNQGTGPEISITPTGTDSLATAFANNAVFKALTEFWDKVTFKGDVEFQKTPVFNKEMAGFAVINQGDDMIDVNFDQEYGQLPVISASMIVGDSQSDIWTQNYAYVLTNQTAKGFEIKLNKPAVSDLKFAWTALAVKDAETFQKPTVTPLPSILPTITAEPTATDDGQITISPVPTTPQASTSGTNVLQ